MVGSRTYSRHLTPDRPPAAPGEQGFAQVLVLASLAILSALLTAALTQGAGTNRYSVAFDLQIRGGAIARSGVDLVVHAIEDPTDNLEASLLAPDRPYVATIAGVETELEIQAEAGKLNPATTDLALLAGYLADAAVPPETHIDLLAELAAPRADGDALAALRLVHARLLRHVDWQQLQRDFGIWNTTAGVDPRFASRAVLAAVPDLSDVENLLRTRKIDPASIHSGSRYFTEGRAVFCVSATARWAADGIASYAEAIEITSGGRVLRLSRSCGY